MNSILAKLRALFRRKNLEAEMAEEMRQHLERRIQEKIGDGMTPDEVRFAAQRDFGGVAQVQEQCRDERRFVWLEQAWQDLCYAAKALRKGHPHAARWLDAGGWHAVSGHAGFDRPAKTGRGAEPGQGRPRRDRAASCAVGYARGPGGCGIRVCATFSSSRRWRSASCCSRARV